MIGARKVGALERILGDAFPDWLMNDGLKVYRWYLERLRCWAHLDRKARELADSLDSEASLTFRKNKCGQARSRNPVGGNPIPEGWPATGEQVFEGRGATSDFKRRTATR